MSGTRLLAGRRALVTGAANGIGLAITRTFVAEGATVAAVDREPTPENLGEFVHSIEWDLSDTRGIDDLVRSAEQAVGPIDVLVNCAGIFEQMPAIEVDLDSYRRVLAVNLDAPVFLTSRLAVGMCSRGYGRVVNVSSIQGRLAEELAMSYDVAKGGLEQATRVFAVELSRYGVLVNAVAPGFVSTRMSIVNGENELEADGFKDVYLTYGKLPIRRYAMPEEVAEQVVWLASSRNSYTTGHVMTVDGGVTLTF